MNRFFVPTLTALLGVAACDPPAPQASTPFAVAADIRLGPAEAAAAPARARSIYAIVPD